MGKKPSSEETMKRRQIIKDLVINRGVTNRSEIKRILDLEYPDLSTTRQTIYKDFALVSKISDDEYHNIGSIMLGNWTKMINDQMDDIDSETDRSKRSKMRKDLSQLQKDRLTAANMLHSGSVRESHAESVRSTKPVTSFSFGEPEVKKEE